MRKLLPLVLLALLVVPSSAGIIIRGSGAACSTPTTGDEMNEGFLGSGYELTTAWTEYVNTGDVVNEDASLPGSPPSGSCTEGLFVSVDGDATVSWSAWDRGSTVADATNLDFYAEIYVTSNTSITDFGHRRIFYWTASGSDPTTTYMWAVSFYDAGATVQLQARASTNSTAVTISTNTWYTVRIHNDATAANSYMQVTGGGSSTCDAEAECTFTRFTSSSMRYIAVGWPNAIVASEVGEIYFGRVWMDSP